MRLYARCKQCKEDVYFTSFSADRFKLARKHGKQIFLDCKSCGMKSSYEPNEIFAEERKGIGLVAMLILVGGTIGLYVLVWKYITRTSDIWAIANFVAFLGTPFLVYQGITKTQRDRIRYFNTKKYG